MSNVSWMPSALSDLEGVRDYIARDSVHYANKFVDDSFDATEILETFPRIGKVVPELGIETVREIGQGSYRIIYEIISDDINIVAMVHGRRLLPDLKLSNPEPHE